MVSPSSPPGKGKRLAREADEAAGKGGGSKRRPFCNGADRGCATAHHPAPKAGRLPSGLAYERTLANRLKEAMQICRRRQRLLVRLLLCPAGIPSTGEGLRNVRRLQARIVKAVQEGRWNKVQALVYLLTHSFSGRAAAILRVTTIPERLPRSGRRLLEHSGAEGGGFQQTPSARLSRAAVTAGLHSEKQRPFSTTSLGNSDHDGSCHAGLVPAGPGSDRGNEADVNSNGF